MCTNHAIKTLQEQKQDTVHMCENATVKLAKSHPRKLILKRHHEGWRLLSRGPAFGSQHPCWGNSQPVESDASSLHGQLHLNAYTHT